MKLMFFRTIIVIIITGILFVQYSCTAQSRYDVLHYVLDGVPNPAAEKRKQARQDSLNRLAAQANKVSFQTPTESNQVFHKPFRERKCGSCHNATSSFSLLQPMPKLCFTCHEDFTKSYKVVHGPVAIGACTTCHHPHSAKEAKLLVRKGNELCLYCHLQSDVLKNSVHTGQEPCRSCHNPHGGQDLRLLRAQN